MTNNEKFNKALNNCKCPKAVCDALVALFCAGGPLGIPGTLHRNDQKSLMKLHVLSDALERKM